jgi:hypothetical protein
MAPNDTQEVVIAFLIKKGTDNINSITELKNYAAQIQQWYDNDFVTDVKETIISIPTEFLLSQNYPNPFNSSCAIKYSIPKSSQVTIKIFNTIGQELATLVNEEKPIGTYEVNWNAANLPSGVYFYRIQAGSFTETKKMMVLK